VDSIYSKHQARHLLIYRAAAAAAAAAGGGGTRLLSLTKPAHQLCLQAVVSQWEVRRGSGRGAEVPTRNESLDSGVLLPENFSKVNPFNASCSRLLLFERSSAILSTHHF